MTSIKWNGKEVQNPVLRHLGRRGFVLRENDDIQLVLGPGGFKKA